MIALLIFSLVGRFHYPISFFFFHFSYFFAILFPILEKIIKTILIYLINKVHHGLMGSRLVVVVVAKHAPTHTHKKETIGDKFLAEALMV